MDTQSKPSITKFLTGGLVAGVVAAVVNNIYNFAYSSAAGFSLPQVIHFGSVTGASIVPLIIGSVFYFVLSRFTPKATTMYSIGAIVLALASCVGPFVMKMPDGTPMPAGFTVLTVPMHIIAGLCAAFVTPKFVQR